MEKNVKLGRNALWIVGIVFACVGGLFVPIGVLAGVVFGEKAWLFGMIYAGVGGFFLVLGVIFLMIEWKKKKRAEQLIAAGRYVWGEIAEAALNPSITMNHRHPYVLIVRYRDSYGTVHQFRSRNLNIPSAADLLGKQVRVYYEDQSFRHYYVDVDPVLPRIVNH